MGTTPVGVFANPFMAHFLRLVWLLCLLHLTVYCFDIPLHPSYHPNDLPYSVEHSKALLGGIDMFTIVYANSKADQFVSPTTRTRVYKETRLLALRAFHPTAEIDYNCLNATPIFGVQMKESGMEYFAAYSKSCIEFIRIRGRSDKPANLEAIKTMNERLRGRAWEHEYMQLFRKSTTATTDILKSSPHHYDFRAMTSYHPQHTLPWPAKTVAKALALHWLQRNRKDLVNMKALVEFLMKYAFPGSTIVNVAPPRHTLKMRVVHFYKQSVDIATEHDPLFAYKLVSDSDPSLVPPSTFVIPGNGSIEHTHIFLHSLDVGVAYSVTDLYSRLAIIKLPRTPSPAKLEHTGILTRIRLPFDPKVSDGFDQELSEYICNIRIQFESTPNVNQSRTVYAKRTFNQLIALILDYLTDVQGPEDITDICLKEDFQLLEPFDGGICYTVGNKLYKRCDTGESIPFKIDIEEPTSLSVSSDGSVVVIGSRGEGVYTFRASRFRMRSASFGLVSSDGKALLFEHPESPPLFVLTLVTLAVLNQVNPSVIGTLALGLMAIYGLYDMIRNCIANRTIIIDTLPRVVLENLEGSVLNIWEYQKLRFTSPNLEHIALASTNSEESSLVSRFPECTPQANSELHHRSKITFLRAERDIFNLTSFTIDPEESLAVYSFRKELETQNMALYYNYGIPFTTAFDRLLDYPNVYQVKGYNGGVVLTRKINGRKHVQLRFKLPSRKELSGMLHKFLSP